MWVFVWLVCVACVCVLAFVRLSAHVCVQRWVRNTSVPWFALVLIIMNGGFIANPTGCVTYILVKCTLVYDFVSRESRSKWPV